MGNNRQSAANKLSNEQIQVLITGKFGDGSLCYNSQAKKHPDINYNWHYQTNSINLEYIQFKKDLLGNLVNHNIVTRINKGYKINNIYSICSVSCVAITEIATESLEDSLNRMDELGLALWFFDDGSLHNKRSFYNLNTQAYSEEINRNLFVPFLKNKFNITAIPTIERKKDGREFWYLRIRKFEGAFYISKLLESYNLNCFRYKLISSETIQKWSKLQEELKSKGIEINQLTNFTLGKYNKGLISIQDIVRAYMKV